MTKFSPIPDLHADVIIFNVIDNLWFCLIIYTFKNELYYRINLFLLSQYWRIKKNIASCLLLVCSLSPESIWTMIRTFPFLLGFFISGTFCSFIPDNALSTFSTDWYMDYVLYYMYSLYFRLFILVHLYFHYFILLVNVFFTSSYSWYIYFPLLHTPGTYTFHFFILLVNGLYVYFNFFILYYVFHISISSS